MLKTLLQKIGLSEKDSEVYLACLELGTQPASVIARKAGLKRPTTYLILEELLKKGLVSEYTGSNVKFFTAVSPDYLLNYIEKQRREFDIIILDPPAFAKNKKSLEKGLSGYLFINERALKILPRGGILISSSCSAHVTDEMFVKMLGQAAIRAGCILKTLEIRFLVQECGW